MKALVRFFLSLNNASTIFVLFIAVAVIGSFSLSNNLAFFSGIDDAPLFSWLRDTGTPGTTWWIYAMIACMALLAVSTIFCSVDALLRRATARTAMIRLSPQVIHIGVLFIMLGHLFTAYLGYRTEINARKGELVAIADGLSMTVSGISTVKDPNGYDIDWDVLVRLHSDGREYQEQLLGPVRPVYTHGYGIYLRSVSNEQGATVLVRVCRDPGAVWALAGGLLLAAGGIAFIYGRMSD